jgi:hypothetical protein
LVSAAVPVLVLAIHLSLRVAVDLENRVHEIKAAPERAPPGGVSIGWITIAVDSLRVAGVSLRTFVRVEIACEHPRVYYSALCVVGSRRRKVASALQIGEFVGPPLVDIRSCYVERLLQFFVALKEVRRHEMDARDGNRLTAVSAFEARDLMLLPGWFFAIWLVVEVEVGTVPE